MINSFNSMLDDVTLYDVVTQMLLAHCMCVMTYRYFIFNFKLTYIQENRILFIELGTCFSFFEYMNKELQRLYIYLLVLTEQDGFIRKVGHTLFEITRPIFATIRLKSSIIYCTIYNK